jgi:hypothetical protein
MDKHLTVLGVLYIVLSTLGLMVAGVVLLTLGGGGLMSGDVGTMSAALAIAVLVSSFFILTSVPGIIAGIGLLRRSSWSRILGIVVAALHLMNIPLGTIIGIYGIWVLVQDDTTRLLATRSTRVAAAGAASP